jgi:hypothetical protein
MIVSSTPIIQANSPKVLREHVASAMGGLATVEEIDYMSTSRVWIRKLGESL